MFKFSWFKGAEEENYKGRGAGIGLVAGTAEGTREIFAQNKAFQTPKGKETIKELKNLLSPETFGALIKDNKMSKL
tara:strand:+ start:11 stop:238 length:228 start_codon:yes stop_codon:yes gene_type:complete